MRKLIWIFLLVLCLCGCTSQNMLGAKDPTGSEQTQLYTSDSATMPVPTVPLEKSVALQAVASANGQFIKPLDVDADSDYQTEMETPISELVSAEDDAYYVTFNQDRMSNLQLDRPDMPTYTWYINGRHDDKIGKVVIEFDILETIHPLHPGYFGFEKGYMITLHHFQTIPILPPWASDVDTQFTHDTDRDDMVSTPEFGVDFQKFAIQDGKHVVISIPYSEFQSAAKDLTLQFFPGTTFANLSINVWGSDALNDDIVDEILKPVELPTRDLYHDEILPTLNEPEQKMIPFSCTNTSEVLQDFLWANPVMAQGLNTNADGSISMPVSLYDLGEYEGAIQGKYAVIPEGLVPALMTISLYSYLGGVCNGDMEKWKQDKRALIDFVFENMMDESGQIFGIYDIEKSKLVAKDRKSPVLPILSAMVTNTDQCGVLSNDEIDFMVNSIIANDLIRMGDTLYYAPHGISDDGVMQLKLSDFAISSDLFRIFIDYSNDENRLDEKYGNAMLLEGFANSLKLVLEGQEQNATRLPASELKVIFTDGGNNYELQSSDTFDINNSFFAVGLIAFMDFGVVNNGGGRFTALKFEKTKDATAKKLSAGNDGVYSDRQAAYIRECEALYSEIYSAYTIQNTLYESWLSIYNFLQVQPSRTAYAPKYNVHTGQMMGVSTDSLYSEFHQSAPLIDRFGTPATPMLYHQLVGIFNNEAMIKETAYLVITEYGWMTSERMFRMNNYNYSNPDFFADNGFNIWGYDSLYALGQLTSTKATEYLYNHIGLNLSRENWREYTMRKLNEQTRKEEDFVSIDDEFPLFYDHLPKVEIVN